MNTELIAVAICAFGAGWALCSLTFTASMPPFVTGELLESEPDETAAALLKEMHRLRTALEAHSRWDMAALPVREGSQL